MELSKQDVTNCKMLMSITFNGEYLSSVTIFGMFEMFHKSAFNFI